MEERRLIWVVGLPSGGTSLIAGMLHHLGVDMGWIRSADETREVGGPRGYMGFECRTMTKTLLALRRPVDLAEVSHEFGGYIRKRLEEPGLHGVKNNALSSLGLMTEVPEFQADIVNVERDLGETFRSDIKYRGADTNRAAWMGQLHLARHELLRKVQPRMTIGFEEALASPEASAERLAKEFGCDLSRIARAAEFVDAEGGGRV